jgi:hypothetical protein
MQLERAKNQRNISKGSGNSVNFMVKIVIRLKTKQTKDSTISSQEAT